MRPVGPGDEAFLLALFGATHEAAALLPEPLVAQQFEVQRRGYSARFPGADDRVVLLEDRPVGRLWVDHGRDVWTLLELALLPEVRNRGIGTELVRDVLAAADAAGVPVRLTVDRANAGATRLYARLGFADVGGDAVSRAMERPAGG